MESEEVEQIANLKMGVRIVILDLGSWLFLLEVRERGV